MEKNKEIRIMKEFDDVNFIPSKEFIEKIDCTFYPNLILLKGMKIDGRLKNWLLTE